MFRVFFYLSHEEVSRARIPYFKECATSDERFFAAFFITLQQNSFNTHHDEEKLFCSCRPPADGHGNQRRRKAFC
jgi:hypothetical protein